MNLDETRLKPMTDER